MSELFTPRLHLRPMSMADVGEMYEICKGPNVGPNAGWKPHETLAETSEILKTMFVGQPDVFGLARRDNGRLVGSMGLVEDTRRENVSVKMLGYSLGEEHWGLGYATEAAMALLHWGFTHRQLSLVSAYRYPANARSGRVLEKCGFRHEGCLREAGMLWNGKVMDVECYSLTAREFACNEGVKQV